MSRDIGSTAALHVGCRNTDITLLLHVSGSCLGCRFPGPSAWPLFSVTCLPRATSSWCSPSKPFSLPLLLGSLLRTQKPGGGPRQLLLWTLQCKPPWGWRTEVAGCFLEWRKGDEARTKCESIFQSIILSCRSSEITVAAERGWEPGLNPGAWCLGGKRRSPVCQCRVQPAKAFSPGFSTW